MKSTICTRWKQLVLTGIAGAACLLIGSAQAAVIAWSIGPTYGGPLGFQGILTNGALVGAYDLGATGSPLTVDPTGLNIAFTRINSPFFNGTPSSFLSGSPGSTDANWNSIINTTEFENSNFTATNFLSGLTIGNSYQVQFFASDIRDGLDICVDTGDQDDDGNPIQICSPRTSSFSNGVNAPSTPVLQGTFTSVVGTFTANTVGQTIGFFSNSGNPILNAYVLRNTTGVIPIDTPPTSSIPEPSTYVLMLGGLVGMGWIARRRRTAGRNLS